MLPIGFSILIVPTFLRLIGDAKYGAISILWVLLGYFGLFDFGVGRATAFYTAKKSVDDKRTTTTIFYSAVVVNTILGLTGALILIITGDFLIKSVIKMPAMMRIEALASLPFLATILPIMTIQSILNGILEGKEKFFTLNTINLIGNIFAQTLPLFIVIFFSSDLKWLIFSVMCGRFVTLIFMLFVTRKYINFKDIRKPDFTWMKNLIRYGKWITLTGIVSPLMATMDRVLIGAQLGLVYVTYYTIPANLISQGSLIPSSLSKSLFPRFSQITEEQGKLLLLRAHRIITVILTPLIIIGFFFIDKVFELWLGKEIALNASPIGLILLLGFWINSQGFIPYSFLQGRGHPDITAKIHLVELIPYILLLIFGLKFAGITGAAWVWTLRVAVDAVVLFIITRFPLIQFKHLVPESLFILVSFVLIQLDVLGPITHIAVGVVIVSLSLIRLCHILIKENYFSIDLFRNLGKSKVQEDDL